MLSHFLLIPRFSILILVLIRKEGNVEDHFNTTTFSADLPAHSVFASVVEALPLWNDLELLQTAFWMLFTPTNTRATSPPSVISASWLGLSVDIQERPLEQPWWPGGGIGHGSSVAVTRRVV